MKPSKRPPPARHGGQTLGTKRTIIHIDLDCFYAQVEMVRNPTLRDRPVGIQQKNIVVTCNYPARKFGVTKLMFVADAMKKCPDLVLVSGEDLTHYREASLAIYKTVSRFSPTVERLVLDELWLDVSAAVEKRVGEGRGQGEWMGYAMTGDGPLQGDQDREKLTSLAAQSCDPATLNRLRIGSIIAAEIRLAVFRETGYTCCAGVAWSKMSSKMTSGLHKPNQQTTLWPDAFTPLLTAMQVRQLPGIGYSTARVLHDLEIEKVEQLQRLPLAYLTEHLGEKMGTLAFNVSRGIDDSPVTPRGPPKSISDEDSFVKCNTVADVHRRLCGLVRSVVARVQADHRETGRLPQTLRLTIRPVGSGYHGKQSRQIAIPPDLFAPMRPRTNQQEESESTNEEDQCIAAITDIAMGLFHRLVPPGTAFHLTLLNVCVANFHPATSSFSQKTGRQPTIAQLLKRPNMNFGAPKTSGTGGSFSVSSSRPVANSQVLTENFSQSTGMNVHTGAKAQPMNCGDGKAKSGGVETGIHDDVGRERSKAPESDITVIGDWSDEGEKADDWMIDSGDDFDWLETNHMAARENESSLQPGLPEPTHFAVNSVCEDNMKSDYTKIETESNVHAPSDGSVEFTGMGGVSETERVYLPEGIDAEVFSQLPVELQNEILFQYPQPYGGSNVVNTDDFNGNDGEWRKEEENANGGVPSRKRPNVNESDFGVSVKGKGFRHSSSVNPSPKKKLNINVKPGTVVGKEKKDKSEAKVSDIRKFFGSGPTLRLNASVNGNDRCSSSKAVDERDGLSTNELQHSNPKMANRSIGEIKVVLSRGTLVDLDSDANMESSGPGVGGAKYKCDVCGLVMFGWCREAHERFHSSEQTQGIN